MRLVGVLAVARFGADGDGALAVVAHDDAVLAARFDAVGDLRQRHVTVAGRAPDQPLQQVVGIDAVIRRGAQQHRDQLVALAQQTDALALAAGGKCARHRLAGQPGIGEAIQRQLRAQHQHRLTPVVTHVEHLALLLQALAPLGGYLAQHLDVRAADARLQLGLGIGAEHELGSADVRRWIALRQLLVDLPDQAVDPLGILGAHEKMHQRGIRLLRRVGEHEARGPGADEARHIAHAVLLGQVLLDLAGSARGIADMRALRQEQVDVEQRRARRREEALRQAGEDHRADHRQHQQRADGQLRPAQHACCQPAIARVPGAVVCGIGLLVGAGVAQQVMAEQRYQQQGQQPAEQQRHGDDEEQREEELAGGVLGQADAGEGEDADDGRPQQRPLRLLQRLLRRLEDALALALTHQHAVADHHRVVHQHAHGDDQRAEGNPLQLDAGQPHHQQRAEHGEKQHRADDHPGAQAHGDAQHADHDGHREKYVEGEAVHRLVDDAVLLVQRVQLGAQRHAVLVGLQHRLDAVPDLDDVRPGHPADTQRQRRLAVVADDLLRPLGVVARELGDGAQLDPLRALADRQRAQLLQRIERPAGAQAHEEVAGIDAAGLHRSVGIAQGCGDLVGGDAHRRQLRLIDLHQDAFLLHASDLHLADAIGGEQRAAQVLGRFVQFLERQTVAGQGVEDTVDITEIVVDLRRLDARRQIALGIVDLVAQLVPDLRQRVTVVAVLHLHADLGYARHRARADLLDLRHLLDGAFQRLGHLLLDLQRRGAGVLHIDDGLLDGEFGVFQAADLEEGEDAAEQAGEHQNPDIDRPSDGVTGEIHRLSSAPALRSAGPRAACCRRRR